MFALSRDHEQLWGNGWLLKRTMAENNGESNSRTIAMLTRMNLLNVKAKCVTFQNVMWSASTAHPIIRQLEVLDSLGQLHLPSEPSNVVSRLDNR